jgi:hypothetical protein
MASMMLHQRLSVAMFAAIAITACAPVAPPIDDTAAKERARAAADALGGTLINTLVGTLEREGPEGALAFCADSAQALTQRFAAEGVEIRRTALRVRNPLNRPDSVERRILDYLAEQHRQGIPLSEVTEIRRIDGVNYLQLARPVLLLERCVTCHGTRDEIPPAIQRVLAERYPADSATGFRPGELRGIVSVRVAIDSATR